VAYGTLFAEADRRSVVERLSRLTPESQRRWGTMTVGRAVAHMADQLRMALGDLRCRPPQGPFRHGPTRFLVIHLLPWPKGRAKGPGEAFKTVPTDLASDIGQLADLIERFAKQQPDAIWQAHPMFGALTRRDWGVLAYRHLDHHLTQFGA
jgi:hypothetical protein